MRKIVPEWLPGLSTGQDRRLRTAEGRGDRQADYMQPTPLCGSSILRANGLGRGSWRLRVHNPAAVVSEVRGPEAEFRRERMRVPKDADAFGPGKNGGA